MNNNNICDSSTPDISVIIPTYNHSSVLCETLENMTGLDHNGLNVEFIVADNNSSDNTRGVIESFADRLSIKYLFEPRPGKNIALNHVLDEMELADIVVFTDDDVTPQKDWLQSIASACNRWPHYSVFGGRTEPLWPAMSLPKWVFSQQIKGWAFAIVNISETECSYPAKRFPAGPNYWVRREVLANGRRFDEAIGPGPNTRIIGDEAKFLKQIRDDGYDILYWPYAIVSHRIRPEMISKSGIKKRAFCIGRTQPHIWGLKYLELYGKHPLIWRLMRVVSLARYVISYALAALSLSSDRRTERHIDALRGMGFNIESLRLACKSKNNKKRG